MRMRIESFIKLIHALPEPDGWVRLEQVRKRPGRLELQFGIHEENRGRKKTAQWNVICLGVREAHITELDGGGLAIYSATHPAVRQYAARRAELRWVPHTDKATTLGALYQAHIDVTDDWIPFNRYVSTKSISGKTCSCRGPEFLMRAYAKALRARGGDPHLSLRRNSKRKPTRLRVLHFGESFVIAAGFRAER